MKPYLFAAAILVCLFSWKCKSDDYEGSIKVSTKLKIALNDPALKSFGQMYKSKIKRLGWRVENDTLVRTVLFPKGKILLSDGSFVYLDKRSNINLNRIPAGVTLKALIFHEKPYLLNRLSSSNVNDPLLPIEYILDIKGYLMKMDEGGCCKKPLKGRNGVVVSSTPRCVDYNGPLGNGLNDQVWWQAAINFIGSDCDEAGQQHNLCWDEHINGMGGCYNTHNNKICSQFIE